MKPLTLALALALGTAPAFHPAQAQTATPSPSASATPATEEVDRSKKPEAGPLPSVTFPETVTETLPNGLRVDLLASHKQPTVTYRLLIKSGDIFDGSKPGLAELTADMLNKGTATLSAEEFAKKTDFLGAAVEATSNEDYIAIIATGLAKDSGELLRFLRDAALNPAFKPSELDKQKRKTVSDLAQKKMQPEELAARLRNKRIYGQHPYGAFATPESVQSITRDDLVKFHSTHFLPNNATLVIVGDVDPATLLAQVKEVFGDWKPGDTPKLDLSSFPEIKGVSVHLIDRPASVQSNIVVAGRGIPRNNPDTPELNVVNTTLGGGMSGRLFANLREKHGFTYGSYSGFSQKKLGGAFSATAEVRNAVTGPAITEILNELRRITSEPIPDSELALQRNYLTGNFLLSLESDQRTAERRQEIDLYGLPEDYYKTYAQRVSSVTPEKAAELAKKYIQPENLDIIVVGNAKEILPQLQKFGPVTVYDTDLKKISDAPQVTPAPGEKPAK